MRTNKIIYWIATGLVAAGMAMSAFMYLSGNAELKQGFAMMGYPAHVIALLGVAKALGAVALVVPGFPRIREWAYAGFSFCFAGAVWAHIATQTPFISPLLFLGLLAVSYIFNRKVSVASSSDRIWAAARA